MPNLERRRPSKEELEEQLRRAEQTLEKAEAPVVKEETPEDIRMRLERELGEAKPERKLSTQEREDLQFERNRLARNLAGVEKDMDMYDDEIAKEKALYAAHEADPEIVSDKTLRIFRDKLTSMETKRKELGGRYNEIQARIEEIDKRLAAGT